MIYISLGANIPSKAGSPRETLSAVIAALPSLGVEVMSRSRFYSTPAWPDPAQPRFVNAVVAVRTKLGPLALLRLLLATEKSYGRVRKTRWEPRCLDLDLIDYGGLVLDETELELPHPRLHERAFVLRPLSDVAPGWRHPDTGSEIAEMLENLGEDGIETLSEA